MTTALTIDISKLAAGGIIASTLLLTAACSEPATPKLSEADLRRHIATLSSDEFEGRAPVTPGGIKTRNYIAQEMKKAGLEPGNGDSWEQEVPLVETTLDTSLSQFTIGSAALSFGKDFMYGAKQMDEVVELEDSQVVFVGFGINAPEYGWNDYADIDVRGKTVLFLFNDPGFYTHDPNRFKGRAMTYYGLWRYKFEEAARQGAAAAFLIHDDAASGYDWSVARTSRPETQLGLELQNESTGLPKVEGWMTYQSAQAILASAGENLTTLQEEALQPGFRARPLVGVKANARLVSSFKYKTSANVIGKVTGASYPDEYIVYMAHWDHLGRGTPDATGDDIYNGAVDNATGVASILSIAEQFSRPENRPERSVLFIAITAEETGFLGSRYFGENPVIPLWAIVGGINIDEILPIARARDIQVYGKGFSELEIFLETAATRRGIRLADDIHPEFGYYYRSDHINLARKGVPMLWTFSGTEPVGGNSNALLNWFEDYEANIYHTPSDEYSESWDLSGMVETLEILLETGLTLANSRDWPNWHQGNEFRALRDEMMSGRE